MSNLVFLSLAVTLTIYAEPTTISAQVARPISGQDAARKLAEPDADQIKQAEGIVSDLYKKELAHPNKDFGRKLLKLAAESKDDAASQFLLLRKAVEIGAMTGDDQTVYSAMDALESTFDVNTVPIWIEALASLSKKTDVSDKVTAIIATVYQRDDYDSALALANLWLVSARNAKNPSAIKTATAKVTEVELAQEEFKKTSDARQTLQSSPTDPEANRTVGSFLCLVKKDWEKGVPMLALGDDATLKSVATLDLKGEKPAEIGDAWNKVKGGQDRALFWYKRALPSLSGLQKARVEKLVKELSPPSPDDHDKTTERHEVNRRPPREWINSSYKTTLRHIEGKNWAEFDDKTGQVHLSYEETGRTGNYIELFCPERQQKLRVFSEKMELLKNGKWEWIANGRWVVPSVK